MCAPLAPISASATAVTTVPADVDGDAYLDLLTTFREEETWGLRVDLGAGGAVVVGIDGVAALEPVAAIGAFDIEGDGTGELFVKVGAGASTTLVQLFDYADCAITPITLDRMDDTFDGVSAIFPVGASIGALSALTCDGGLLWTSNATLSDDQTFYEVMDIPYSLSGSVLIEGFGDGAVIDVGEATGPLFACGDLTLP